MRQGGEDVGLGVEDGGHCSEEDGKGSLASSSGLSRGRGWHAGYRTPEMDDEVLLLIKARLW